MFSRKREEDTTPDITEHNTQPSLEKSFAYNATKAFKPLVPENPIFSFDEIESLPPTEKPLYSPYSVKLSMYLIIVGALVIVILAVIISFCFCYGCRSL